MAFNDRTRKLYVFGGYRTIRTQKQYVSDLWSYSFNYNEVKEICSDCSARGGPDPGFTQRLMVDSDAQELYVYVRQPYSLAQL